MKCLCHKQEASTDIAVFFKYTFIFGQELYQSLGVALSSTFNFGPLRLQLYFIYVFVCAKLAFSGQHFV